VEVVAVEEEVVSHALKAAYTPRHPVVCNHFAVPALV
jgi:hypothetical protein